MTNELYERFEERLDEIIAYLDFLEAIESIVRSGIPRLGGPDGPVVTAQQQRILYSGVYLQLYNLVEATVTACLDAVSKIAMQRASWAPGDLTKELRREWVKHVARTNVEMGADRRLEEVIALCDHLVAALPVSAFDIDKGGGGNWDDGQIRRIALRIGCDLKVSKHSYSGVKRVVRNDLGAMALIVDLRNKLAHGSLSFVECGQDDSAAQLRDLAERVAAYLREVVDAFAVYIREHRYLRPERRPKAILSNG
jgi:MAE_28990/MAE_18760-like HEPN